MAKQITTLSELVDLCLDLLGQERRTLLAIAGAPGSGKSTLCEELEQELNAQRPDSTAIVPMDGFHYDNAVLDEIGARDRKGAPHTFDIAGFFQLLQRLSSNEEDAVVVPVFDRELDLSRGSARRISKSKKLVLVEGNYLLLNHPDWAMLRPLFDATLMIRVTRESLEQRLIKRWLDMDVDQAGAESWVASNDMPNVDLVLTQSVEADVVYLAASP